ncbi:MAG: hypothetical protein ACI3ZP_04450 [Candidatus Cryptobacteroides sp.]
MNSNRSQERIARLSAEEDRRARRVTNLTRIEKKVFRDVAANLYEDSDGVSHNSIEAAALRSLESWGLVHLRSTKAGVGARITDKGRLLLYDNKKLRFPVPENTRWIITTILSCLAIVISIISLVTSLLLQ